MDVNCACVEDQFLPSTFFIQQAIFFDRFYWILNKTFRISYATLCFLPDQLTSLLKKGILINPWICQWASFYSLFPYTESNSCEWNSYGSFWILERFNNVFLYWFTRCWMRHCVRSGLVNRIRTSKDVIKYTKNFHYIIMVWKNDDPFTIIPVNFNLFFYQRFLRLCRPLYGESM